MRLFLTFSTILISFCCNLIYSQVSTIPVFPEQTDSVTIIFNSLEGNKGLQNYFGDVYAHTGVITNLSTSTADWKYVKTAWGANTPETKLTKIGASTYILKIAPSIKSYYGVPANEKILKIAFVFRSETASNGGSYYEGKAEGNSDIFAAVYDAGLNLFLQKPASDFSFYQVSDSIPVLAIGSYSDSLLLFRNNEQVFSTDNDSISKKIPLIQSGKTTIKVIAKDALNQKSDSFNVFVVADTKVMPMPANTIEGINYVSSTSVVLCLYASMKNSVFVLGDFNNWELDTNFQMFKDPDGQHFWLQINNLQASKEYVFQYLVDGVIRVGDPYCEKVSDPWNDSYISNETYPGLIPYPTKAKGIASVLQTNQIPYAWKNQNFNGAVKEKLVIYELLVRDFNQKHSFQAVIDSLNYLKKLGVNAIELMPVNEFEGNNSWGYNPNYYFAVDKYYGGKNALKALIDSCHSNGIAVILDVVYNHSFGTSPYVMMYWDAANNRPLITSPFFNPIAKHDYNVGFDFNHESSATKKYISRALRFWLTEFKVDGFRFDLSKGFTQKQSLGNVSLWGNYDASRIAILSAYNDTIKSIKPNAYTILEHFADNTEEKELASRGMLLWGNHNSQYAEAAMGYNSGSKSDFSNISYKKRNWTQANLVGYMESHDEERLMYKCSQWGNSNGSYIITKPEIYPSRAALDAVFFLSIPGPKMIWQFGELAYDVSIDFNGRTGEKPIKWEYFDDLNRKNTYQVYAALNALRMANDSCFMTSDFMLDVASDVKKVTLNSSALNLIAIGNFDVSLKSIDLSFPHNGYWYDYFSGSEVLIENNSYTLSLDAGEYHIFTDKPFAKPELSIPAIPIVKIFTDDLFQLYPNPSIDKLFIYINTKGQSSQLADISIYSLDGTKLSHKEYSIAQKTTLSIGEITQSLSAGVYLCKVIIGSSVEIKKFIIY